jgi:hypothetical protein
MYSKKLGFALSVESPDPSVDVPDSLLLEPVTQSYPDLAGRINTTGKWGRLQLAGILRSMTVRNLDGDLGIKTGYGFLLSNLFNLGKGFQIMSQALYGAGISSYLNVSSNAASDVILNPVTGVYEINDAYGGFISFAKSFLKDDLAFTLTYGLVKFIKTDIQPDTYFNAGQYATANAFWNSRFGFRIGLEYEFGHAKNKQGEEGTANRFAFTTYFDF